MILNQEQRKITLLSAIGGMLEFYDFTIYGLFSVYFAQQIFATVNSFSAIIASYSVFVVGYIARPLGGIVFGHIGDVIGRKTVLILTMALMGVSSLGIGFLPTYAQIGLYSPILMALLRLTQGLAIGGELPSVIVYVTESIPNKRGTALGVVFSVTICGLMSGMLINLLITHFLTISQINSFGWRLPFILGGGLCFVAYQVRRKLHEITNFKDLKQKNRFPLGELIKHHMGKILIGVGLISIVATPIMLAIIFMPTYLIQILKLDPTRVSNIILFTTVLSSFSVYIMGKCADYISPFKLMLSSLIGLIFASAICYLMLYYGYNLTIALSIFAISQGILVVLPILFLSYLFPLQISLVGVAISYNLAFVIFGGLIPVIITTIIKYTNLAYITPFLSVFVVSCIALLALYKCKKYLPSNI